MAHKTVRGPHSGTSKVAAGRSPPVQANVHIWLKCLANSYKVLTLSGQNASSFCFDMMKGGLPSQGAASLLSAPGSTTGQNCLQEAASALSLTNNSRRHFW
eukprot:1155807-Pelagomonas_calceolata.AAC.5